VFVTTLITGITKKYSIEDHLNVRYFWLNGCLLVIQPFEYVSCFPCTFRWWLLTKRRSEYLYTCLLDTGTIIGTQIPSDVQHVTLHGNRVGIVAKYHALTWIIGHGTQFINATNVLKAILFHPTSQDTVVVVSSQRIEPEDLGHVFILRLIAEEYNTGKLNKTAFIDIPLLCDRKEDNLQLDIRSIDNNGVYSVGWIFEGIADLRKIPPHACDQELNQEFHHLISYDIYHKKFLIQCFFNPEPERAEFLLESYFWAGRMFSPTLRPTNPPFHHLFQPVTAYDQILENPPAIRNICASNSSLKDQDVELKGQEHGLVWLFTYELNISQEKPGLFIRGDNRFQVILAETGYVVLCFEENVILPSVQLSMKNLAFLS